VNLGPARGESCALRVAALRVGVKRPEDRGPRAVGRALSGWARLGNSVFDDGDGLAARAALAQAARGALNAAPCLF